MISGRTREPYNAADPGGNVSDEKAAAPTPRPERIPRGILLMIGATLCFAVNNAMSKWLVAIYPVGEVLFTRAAISLIVVATIILPRTGLAVFASNRRAAHVKRAISQAVSQTCIVIAFSLMPLAAVTAIAFSAPLFATLISAVVLKEPIGLARWSVLLVGFLGVLMVTHPDEGLFQVGAAFALANAILYASVTVAVRGMTATESTDTLTMYQMVLLTVFLAALLPFGWATPTLGDAGIMIASAMVFALGQYLWTRSLHFAPASAIMPFYYLSLVWAAVLGFAIWGDAPTLALVIGSATVVASGLFLLWHESRRPR